MDHATIRVHLRVVEDVQQKRDKLREELRALEAVERYHMAIIEQYSREEEQARAETERPANSAPGSPLAGKTMAEAAEFALLELGRSCQAKEVAELLACCYGYGEGSSNRSYVNALYNAMSRKPEIFCNSDGIWSLRRHANKRIAR